MKRFLRYLKAYLGTLKEKDVPLKVSHHLLYDCNLSCSFCERYKKDVETLPTRKVKEIMDDFSGLGTLFWSFNGGEPTLREDLGELISHAKECGFFTSLVTNGTMVQKRIEDLGELDLVQISVDGFGKTHDEIRGKGTFEKINRSIDLLHKEDVEIQSMTVLNKKNSRPGEIEKIISWAEDRGMWMNFQPIYIQPEDVEKRARNFYPEREEMKRTCEELIEEKKQGRPINTSSKYLKAIKDNWPDSRVQRCWAGKISCNISPDGFLSPCCEKLPLKKEKANILEYGAEKAFEELPDMSNCSDCYSNFEMELSFLMNNRPGSLVRAFANAVQGNWVWS